MRNRYLSALACTMACLSVQAVELDRPAPVMATHFAGVGDYAHMTRCEALPDDEARNLEHQHRRTWSRAQRLDRPSNGAQLLSAPPTADDPYAGTVPADYVNPVEHVREVGHLFHEVEVEVISDADHYRLAEVLDFEAPDWARMMLVEFTPSEQASERARPGLFLRPHRPFTEGHFHEPDRVFVWDSDQLEQHFMAQASYYSYQKSHRNLDQFLLITRDMDPAPAGKRWHVAIGQMRSDEPVEGTLRVSFSGSSYRAPLAIEFYYDAAEEEAEVGFFDPTEREPNGDNPGTTQGEAMRWILFRSAERLLEELDFHAPFPIRVLVTTQDDPSAGIGVASSNVSGGWVNPRRPAPGRLRARPGGSPANLGAEDLAFHKVPLPAWEREAGTDACRSGAVASASAMGTCPDDDLPLTDPGRGGSAVGWTRLLRDYELTSGPQAGTMWRWDKNLDDQTGRPNIVNLIKHELLHIIGFIEPEKSQAYMATFDPPRPRADGPTSLHLEEHWGIWSRTFTRQHHYGPIASTSPRNPWRHTHEPGPRLQDDNPMMPNFHLSGEDGDELAEWGAGELDSVVRTSSLAANTSKAGIAREILADVGYATNTWAIQDRRLPRHWFDPTRSGHGIDFRRVEREDGSMVHFLHFYTYDAHGEPEWYMAVGEVNDEMIFEASLDYIGYADDRNPPQQVDPARSGTVRIDLDPALDDPACADRWNMDKDGVDHWLLAAFEFDLPDGSDRWCMQPLEFGRLPAFPQEGSGSWFASDDEDVGWGLSVLTRNWGPRPIVNAVVYYYDADGEPTWAWGLAGGDYMLPYGSLGNGVEIDMLHFTGFCRTCEPVQPSTETAGVLRLQLNEQTTAAHTFNRVELLDLTHPGPAGGHWLREDVGIKLLSSPHPAMFQ